MRHTERSVLSPGIWPSVVCRTPICEHCIGLDFIFDGMRKVFVVTACFRNRAMNMPLVIISTHRGWRKAHRYLRQLPAPSSSSYLSEICANTPNLCMSTRPISRIYTPYINAENMSHHRANHQRKICACTDVIHELTA